MSVWRFMVDLLFGFFFFCSNKLLLSTIQIKLFLLLNFIKAVSGFNT